MDLAKPKSRAPRLFIVTESTVCKVPEIQGLICNCPRLSCFWILLNYIIFFDFFYRKIHCLTNGEFRGKCPAKNRYRMNHEARD